MEVVIESCALWNGIWNGLAKRTRLVDPLSFLFGVLSRNSKCVDRSNSGGLRSRADVGVVLNHFFADVASNTHSGLFADVRMLHHFRDGEVAHIVEA